MPKIHARMSVEIEVTEEQFKQVMELAGWKPHKSLADVDIGTLPRCIQEINLSKSVPCDWDDGGYIPGSWLEYDIVESGLVSWENVAEV